MGKATGLALKVAAPEASAAKSVAGGGRRPPAKDPRAAAPGSKAAQQREAIEQIKAKRAPEPAAEQTAPADPAPTSSGAGPSLPSLPSLPSIPAAQTGSGLLLGVFVWALGLAYLQGGSAGVRKFMAAKFLNKTT